MTMRALLHINVLQPCLAAAGIGHRTLPNISAEALRLLASQAQQTSEQSLPPAQGPLVGIRVLDLGQVVAGNFAGAVFAYFGADVIKGRNRRCMTANLHVPEGREIIKRLSEKADVLLENFRPGVMEGWGLGPADLKKDLIYTRISGYGQSGPRAKEPGYASVCEAFGGFRHLNGYPDRPPVRPNISLGDTLAAVHAVLGAVMALLHKQRLGNTAPGQVVDSSITESVFNMLDSAVTEYAMAGQDRQPSGSTISDVVPSGTFRCKEGKYVVIGGNGDAVYSRLMTSLGRADMAATAGPRYANNAARCKHVDEIMGVIEDWVAQHSIDEVIATMTKARVPCGPILSTAGICSDPQYQARGMIEKAAAPGGGPEITVPAILPLLSRTPGATRWAGPELGQHTVEILTQELGLSAQEIEELRSKGAI